MRKLRIIQSHCDGAATVAEATSLAEATRVAMAFQRKAKKSPWGPVMHTIFGERGRRLKTITNSDV